MERVIAIRRSVRQRATRTPFTPAKTISLTKTKRQTTTIHTDNDKVDYELNRSKAIKQKIEAAERPLSVVVKLTMGGIVLTFSAAAYEEFKIVTMNYLKSQNLILKTTQTTDKHEAVVSESVSVYQNSSKLFVLNLYNSTSKILLNGNHHHILDFVNQYLVNILSILDHNDKFKDINSKIREYCGQYLTNAGNKDMESGKTATMPNTEIRQIESISENNILPSLIDSTDNPETDYPVCPICSRPCDDKPTSVACDICNSWLHYECENITPEEETKLDDPGTNYICILCNYQHDTMIGKEGAIQSISYHSSQKGDTDNNKTDRPTPHFRAQHILSRPQQVEKQTTQPSSQSIKTPTVNRDRVLSPNRVTRPKQPYQPTQTGITQNTKMSEKAIIENLQNETDILQTSLSEKERLLIIKENQTTKLETEVTHLKKQLSTNRSYSITLEGKNRELQRSNMIATQRIEQLEMELQRNNAKPQQEYPHVQYPQNQNAYRNEAADMKVWFLEQKLRQLELDVHRNNTELLMMKSQPPQGRRQAPMPRYYNQRKRKNEYMNNANPSLRMPNITHNRDHTLCDQMDDFLQPTRNDETFLNTGDNSDHFLFHPRPPKIRDKHLTGAPPIIPSLSRQ